MGNVAGEVKFAGTYIMVNGEIVAKVTSFERNVSVDEEEITGSEDRKAGTDILGKQFTPIAAGETAAMEGITIETAANGLDDGQSELKDAAENGDIVVVRHVKPNGYGHSLTGFFTEYSEKASTTETYKYKSTFRVNEKVEITPGS